MTFTASQWQPTTYDNDTFKLDNYDFMVSSEKAYSFKYNASTDTYRFEVRDGDQFTSTRFSDVAGSERSEISQSLRQSISGAANYTSAKWSFMIEPGQANTAKWMSLGQFHSGMNKSGPFDFGLRGDDKLSFVIRSSQGEKEIELPANVQRGHWYDIKVDLHFGPSGGGYVKVWLDGQQVVNYAGAVGYTDQSTTHWNMGIYRSSPAGGETIAYNVKGLDLSYGSSASAANHGALTDSGTSAPAPTPAPTQTETPSTTPDVGGDQISNDGNLLVGRSGRDTIIGTSDADIIFGKSGSDVLTGGEGKDTFVFDTALGSSNVDTIKDFTPGVDKIELSSKVFTSLRVQELGTDVFHVGTKALDHNDHILYDQAKGTLSYDADGNGNGAAVQFAKVAAGLALSASDFYAI